MSLQWRQQRLAEHYYKGYDPVKDEETDDEAKITSQSNLDRSNLNFSIGEEVEESLCICLPYRQWHADKGEILLYNILKNYYALCISIVDYSCFSKSVKLVLV